MTKVIQDTDSDACTLAQTLLQSARHAALAVMIEPSQPMVTRIALAQDMDGAPLSLISDLATHTRALREHAACSLLIGEPGEKGDVLAHPRLTLVAKAQLIPRDHADHDKRAAQYLEHNPKAKLYLGLGDFKFVRFDVQSALLNAGFGKAYHLTPADLAL